jgi:hypothetical protein
LNQAFFEHSAIDPVPSSTQTAKPVPTPPTPTAAPFLTPTAQPPSSPVIETAAPCKVMYGEADAVSNAIDYAKHGNCSHDAVTRVYDSAF